MEDLKIQSDLLHQARILLREVFGYTDFRPSQAEIITALFNQHNVLALMPTGAGKSMCYQIPALLNNGLTLVISPLIALMDDQVAALRLAGVNA
ncbi:MAG: DEAD/DEAH box helicase, partial [Neisseriaceae bacterium]|nr:DEAD/DEAH box helicase [Neisseriaceae bacterium]